MVALSFIATLMLNGPIKFALVSGLLAVVGVSFLSKPGEGPVASSPSGRGFLDRLTGESARVFKPDKSFTTSSTPPAMGFGPVRISGDASGQYDAVAEIDGRRMRMRIDPNAAFVTLTVEDAAAAGIVAVASAPRQKVATAQGEVMAAKVQLRDVRIGAIAFRDVAAVILPPGSVGPSVIGMSFLGKLKNFEIAAGSMVLNP